MKTEQEIKIKIKKIKEYNKTLHSAFAEGNKIYIKALEWVLETDQTNK